MESQTDGCGFKIGVYNLRKTNYDSARRSLKENQKVKKVESVRDLIQPFFFKNLKDCRISNHFAVLSVFCENVLVYNVIRRISFYEKINGINNNCAFCFCFKRM